MTTSEVIDFTGFERRFPNEEEIDLVASKSALIICEMLKRRGRLTDEDEPARLEQEKILVADEIRRTGVIYDMPDVGKKMLIYDHLEITAVVHDDYEKQLGVSLTEEQKEAVGKAVGGLHNHLDIYHNIVAIKGDKVWLLNTLVQPICLK